VPLASVISSHFGWQAVFIVAVALNATAALMALFVIKPLRRAFILGNEITAETATSRSKAARRPERSIESIDLVGEPGAGASSPLAENL
jgi:predicted MFS family arabinose efflux permease